MTINNYKFKILPLYTIYSGPELTILEQTPQVFYLSKQFDEIDAQVSVGYDRERDELTLIIYDVPFKELNSLPRT